MSHIRPFIKPILITAGAAFVFLTAGCGKQQSVAPTGTSAASPFATSGKPTASAAPGAKTTNKQPGKQPELYKPKEDAIPPLEMDGQLIKLNWVENNQPRMRATVTESQVHQLNKTGSAKGFSGTLYENGKPTTTMTAPLIVYDMQTRVLTATGGVVVTSLDRKTVVKSKWMRWFSREQKVVGNGGVTANSDLWNMNGPGFVADTALKTVVVRKLVKGSDY